MMCDILSLVNVGLVALVPERGITRYFILEENMDGVSAGSCYLEAADGTLRED